MPSRARQGRLAPQEEECTDASSRASFVPINDQLASSSCECLAASACAFDAAHGTQLGAVAETYGARPEQSPPSYARKRPAPQRL